MAQRQELRADLGRRFDGPQKLQFTRPGRQILLMVIVLGAAIAGAYVALPRVLPVFQANPYLNGFIVAVFCIGVLACFWQVIQLFSSVRWIEDFADEQILSAGKAPRLLTSLASLLRERGKRMQLPASSTRSILDSVATRIDEEREITRYIVNLLIFLGLLGTFYGLATTVPAVVDTIRSLAPQEGEAGTDVFNRLMTGLESQLGGMGVAFASSLLGLAGSLIVGLLELFASHGQNRFYRELENWLSSITRVGMSSGEDAGTAMAGVFDRMAEQIDVLQQTIASSEASRIAIEERLGTVAQAIETLARKSTDGSGGALARVATAQERLVDLLEAAERDGGIDTESRMRLRSIDVQMLRMSEEIAAGRQELMAELRHEIIEVVHAIAQASGNEQIQRRVSARSDG